MSKNKKMTKRMKAKVFLRLVISLTVLGLFLRFFVFLPTEINGVSMNPTLEEGDHLLVNTFGEVERFDVIVFTDQGDRPIIKRVIGLPGDTLYYYDDELFVNGQAIEEPFVKRDKHTSGLTTSNFTLDQVTDEVVIPKGQYFVLGDNRRFSFDSRHYGNIDEASIIGRVKIIYYPFDRLTILE